MSHIVTITTKVRDPAAVAAACQRLGLAVPVQGKAELFSGEATGLVVKLKDWQYPMVIDVQTGELRYDNYNGAWGAQEQLDRFPDRTRTIRKPRLLFRCSGGFRARNADRQFWAESYQLPPRHTRIEPSAGPGGSRCGLFS